jgi:DNA polymerase gamma 1
MDWTCEAQKMTKPKFKKDGTYSKNGEPRPIKGQKLPGVPAWYRKLYTEKTGISITARKTATPYLYRLEWVDTATGDAFPLFYNDKHKWGYLVPKTLAHHGLGPHEWTALDGVQHTTHSFFKLPHPGGPSANCGSPISNSFLRYVEEGKLRSQFPYAKEALAAAAAGSYWVSSNNRILSQFVVWDDLVPRAAMLGDNAAAAAAAAAVAVADPAKRLGMIIPMLITAGTVTRRAVESTWLTASNPKKTRIGSELKSKVIAPPGYSFVGADVDSEELWIASLLGDAAFAKSHGSTALGWMTLLGSKGAGTDMHSRTGKTLGITRDQAKVVNYGALRVLKKCA